MLKLTLGMTEEVIEQLAADLRYLMSRCGFSGDVGTYIAKAHYSQRQNGIIIKYPRLAAGVSSKLKNSTYTDTVRFQAMLLNWLRKSLFGCKFPRFKYGVGPIFVNCQHKRHKISMSPKGRIWLHDHPKNIRKLDEVMDALKPKASRCLSLLTKQRSYHDSLPDTSGILGISRVITRKVRQISRQLKNTPPPKRVVIDAPTFVARRAREILSMQLNTHHIGTFGSNLTQIRHKLLEAVTPKVDNTTLTPSYSQIRVHPSISYSSSLYGSVSNAKAHPYVSPKNITIYLTGEATLYPKLVNTNYSYVPNYMFKTASSILGMVNFDLQIDVPKLFRIGKHLQQRHNYYTNNQMFLKMDRWCDDEKLNGLMYTLHAIDTSPFVCVKLSIVKATHYFNTSTVSIVESKNMSELLGPSPIVNSWTKITDNKFEHFIELLDD